MPLNSVEVGSVNFTDAATLNKTDATGFSVSVRNQTVQWQVNIGPKGSDSWVPAQGVDIYPGDYSFDASDWAPYGTQTVQGIRFRAKIAGASPTPVVTAS